MFKKIRHCCNSYSTIHKYHKVQLTRTETHKDCECEQGRKISRDCEVKPMMFVTTLEHVEVPWCLWGEQSRGLELWHDKLCLPEMELSDREQASFEELDVVGRGV